MSQPPQSQPRQNYHVDNEAGVNKQINLHLHASYVLQSMAFYFDRDDSALAGFHEYFKKASDEERELAESLMKYQNQRGGRIVLQAIKKPERDEWGSGLEAMTAALALHKTINQSLLELRATVSQNNDTQMGDFLEDKFLTPRVESIKEVSDHMTRLRHVGSGLGEHVLDRELN